MKYRIEADFALSSEWMPQKALTQHYDYLPSAIVTAIEGASDPKEEEVRVVCVETGEGVWRSSEKDYE
jgi:hypothetical protein